MHLTFSSKNFTRIVLLFLFAIHLSAAQAETVYVDDRLRVGVRKETGNRIAPHAIVHTGMKLEILEEDGNFIRIKTEKGIEGWIKKTYVTPDRPAKDLLTKLRKSHNELKNRYEALKNETSGSNNGDASEKIEGLQKQNRDLRKQAEKLNKKISSLSADKTGNKQIQDLQKQNDILEEQIIEMGSSSEAHGGSSSTTNQYDSWLSLVTVNVLMILVGFSAGFLWFRRQMLRRLGGAEN